MRRAIVFVLGMAALAWDLARLAVGPSADALIREAEDPETPSGEHSPECRNLFCGGCEFGDDWRAVSSPGGRAW